MVVWGVVEGGVEVVVVAAFEKFWPVCFFEVFQEGNVRGCEVVAVF